jgi:hypothetical protein
VLVAAEDIAFFPAIQDEAVYAKNPTKYERLVVNDRTGTHEYYMEKHPTHVISKNAIESVTVSEMRKFTATGESFPESKPNSHSKAARPVPRFIILLSRLGHRKVKDSVLLQKQITRAFLKR